MNNKLSGWEDTVVALATAPGVAAIGVVRLSGNNALEIASKIFPSKNISEQKTHTLHFGLLKDGNDIIDEVVISTPRPPTESYIYMDHCEIKPNDHSGLFVKIAAVLICGLVLYWWWGSGEEEEGPLLELSFSHEI